MAVSNIPLDKAELLALVLESLVYGVFLATFVGTTWMLYTRAANNKPNYLMIGVMIGMFAIATTHLVIDIVRAFEAFIKAESALAYYANLADPTFIAKTLVFVFQTALGDGFFVYRVWVVWRRQLLPILIPIMSLVGTFLTGCGVVYELIHITPGAEVFASTLTPWITSFFSLTLSTNILCTILIAGRIYHMSRQLSSFGSRGLGTKTSPAFGIIIESGAVISAAIFSQLVVYLHGSNGQFPALDLLTPLMGVVFCMIIIRVSMGYALEQSGTHHQSSGWRGGQRPGVASHAPSDYNMGPVTVNVSKYVQRDTDVEGGGYSSYDTDEAKVAGAI